MENEPKGGSLPVILAGLVMVGCCLLVPFVIVGAGAGLAGWFGGLSIGKIAALAGLAALVVYGVVRLRRAMPIAGGEVPDNIAEEAKRRPK